MILAGTHIHIMNMHRHIQMYICYSGIKILAMSINWFVHLNMRTWLLYQLNKIWLEVDAFAQMYTDIEWGFSKMCSNWIVVGESVSAELNMWHNSFLRAKS